MTPGLKSYPLYKDSSVPWLGQVPTHWSLRRTKTLLRERVEKGFPDEALLAATQTKGVVRKDQYENRTVIALKDLHVLKLVRVGDFVISLRSFQGGIEFAREQGIISPAYTVLYVTDPGTHGFLAWLFKSKPYIENLALYVTGIRQGQNIDYEKLNRSTIPLPPSPEQAAIVRFLDHADRRIRRYIRAKQKMINLLAEKREAVTHDALRLASTRSLPLRAVAEKVERPINRGDDQVYTPIGLFNRGRGIFHKEPTKGAELGDSTFFWIEEGDLVLSGQFAWEGAIALAGQEDTGCVATHRYPVLRGKPNLLESAYLLSFFKTGIGHLLLDQHSRGAAGRNRPLNDRTLMKERIPIPPLPVQHRISAIVHLETRLYRAVARAGEMLREYRTRLIADVVTGKLDVREAATRLPEEADEAEPLDEADALTDAEQDAANDLDAAPKEAEA